MDLTKSSPARIVFFWTAVLLSSFYLLQVVVVALHTQVYVSTSVAYISSSPTRAIKVWAGLLGLIIFTVLVYKTEILDKLAMACALYLFGILVTLGPLLSLLLLLSNSDSRWLMGLDFIITLIPIMTLVKLWRNYSSRNKKLYLISLIIIPTISLAVKFLFLWANFSGFF